MTCKWAIAMARLVIDWMAWVSALNQPLTKSSDSH